MLAALATPMAQLCSTGAQPLPPILCAPRLLLQSPPLLRGTSEFSLQSSVTVEVETWRGSLVSYTMMLHLLKIILVTTMHMVSSYPNVTD